MHRSIPGKITIQRTSIRLDKLTIPAATGHLRRSAPVTFRIHVIRWACSIRHCLSTLLAMPISRSPLTASRFASFQSCPAVEQHGTNLNSAKNGQCRSEPFAAKPRPNTLIRQPAGANPIPPTSPGRNQSTRSEVRSSLVRVRSSWLANAWESFEPNGFGEEVSMPASRSSSIRLRVARRL